MSVSAPFLGLGLAMTGLGTILLLLSVIPRNEGEDVEYRSSGMIFLGPIPIVFGGRNRWAIAGITILAMIFLFVAAAMAQPEILGL
jgi:uncharacterized protein (TIGR00304 family)